MDGSSYRRRLTPWIRNFLPDDMESYSIEESVWASGVAARLKLLQANFADDQPETRRGYLSEELERSLRNVPPSRREQHLTALGSFFPAWSGESPKALATAAPVAPIPQIREESAEELFERWMASASTLSPSAKLQIGARLSEAGLIPKAVAAGPLESTPELSKVFGFTEAKPPNPDRSVKLLASLAGVFLALDQLVWTLWRQLNPKSIYRKESEFNRLAGPHLLGDPEISSEQIRQTVERTRRLIAALLGAVGRGGSNFARKHATDLAPDSIEAVARNEKKAWESLEAVSWRKYKDLYKEYATEQTVESQIQQEFVRAAEELLKGIGR